MNRQNQGFHGLGGLILALVLAGPVTGAEDDGASVAIDAAGLDLARLPDAQALYGHIRSVAISLCRAERASWDVKRLAHHRRCVEAAVDGAVARANRPLLTAVHRAFAETLAEQ